MFKINEEEIVSAKPYIEKLDQFYFGLIAMPMLIFVLGLLKYTKEGVVEAPIVDLPFALVGALTGVGVILIVLINRSYRSQVKDLNKKELTLKAKMVDYFTISLRYYFYLELVALVWALAYYLDGDKLFSAVGIIQIGWIAYERTSAARLAKQLRVNKQVYTKLIKDELI